MDSKNIQFKKVAIVGGSGFIGTYTGRLLIDLGYDVTVLDIVEPQYKCNWVQCDITESNLISIFQDNSFDYVFHLAAMIFANDCRKYPSKAINTNYTGVANVLEACRVTQVKRFIFSSTVHVYQAANERYVDENVSLSITCPQNLYIATKMQSEHLIRSYHTEYGTPYTIMRYGIAYGKGGHKDNVIHRFTYNIKNNLPITIFGDGTAKRSFLYVTDHARANAMCLNLAATNETINFDSNEVVNLHELIEKIESVVNKKAIIEYADNRKNDYTGRVVYSEKAFNLLKWKPMVHLSEGIMHV